MGYSDKEKWINNSEKCNYSNSYSEPIQSDNKKEFTNKILSAYFAEIEAKHLYVSLYHLKEKE